jgi:adenosine deaminase
METSNAREYIHSLPKTEIHIHAEATISLDSYYELNKKYSVDPHLNSVADFRKLLKIDSLNVMIKNFFYLQSFFRAPEDFLHVVTDVAAYAKRNNIWYLELYLSPSMVLRNGFVSFDDMLDPIVEGFSALAASGGPDIRLLIDVSRSFGFDNAKRNFDLLSSFLKKRSTDRVLGIGLGGQEIGNPCTVYKDIFREALDSGLHAVAHAGEEVGPESIWNAVDELGAERIGHGTSAILDSKLMDSLGERGIPLEICPASNIMTKKYVKEYKDHPIRAFFDRGLMVTLNTDDPILFSVELDDEYERVSKHLSFSREEILTLVKNGLKSTFMDPARKEEGLARLEAMAASLSAPAPRARR